MILCGIMDIVISETVKYYVISNAHRLVVHFPVLSQGFYFLFPS